jgi:hypothetical protein
VRESGIKRGEGVVCERESVIGRDRESDGTQAGIFCEGKVVQTHQLYEVLHDRHGI